MQLHFLTNPDKNLEQKMRYFSDCFVFTNCFLGKLPSLPFDNPQSLVNKIIFQIDNNIDHSARYIENYISQLTHFFEGFLINDFPSYQKVQSGFASYNLLETKERPRVKWLKDHPDFLDDLRVLHADLEKNLFNNIFKKLLQYIVCRHQLQRHKKDIHYCTQIMVSLFRLEGYSEEVVGDFIKRILSSDRTSFPLPLDFYQHDSSEKFVSLSDEFLSHRDFRQQFEGLHNLMVNPKHRKGYFIYVINGVRMEKEDSLNFKVQVDNVIFISPYHSQFKQLRKELREDSKKEKFINTYSVFFGKDKLLAYVELNFDTRNHAADQGFHIVVDKLKQFNQYVDEQLTVAPVSYLFTEDFNKEGWKARINSLRRNFSWLSEYKVREVKDNPFEILKDVPSPLKTPILHNETVFVNAVADNHISFYWQYIENLFWFKDDSGPKREKFLKLVMTELQFFFNDLFFGSIADSFLSVYHQSKAREIGLTEKELRTIMDGLNYTTDIKFPVAKWKAKIKHPFLKFLLDNFQQLKSKKYSSKWQSHFASLILELQEYRNAELHSGRVNLYATVKLRDVLPTVMNEARWLVIYSCIKNPNLTFRQLMDKIST